MEVSRSTALRVQRFDRLACVKIVEAAEFERTCLAVLDEVAATGEVVTILRHGQPVGRLASQCRRWAATRSASL